MREARTVQSRPVPSRSVRTVPSRPVPSPEPGPSPRPRPYDPATRPGGPVPLYFVAMNSTITPAPKSSVAVRFELPPEQLTSALDEAVRHLARRTRIPGFRPGKAPRAVVERSVGAPAILDEALDHLVQRAYRDALVEHDLTPLTNADIEIEQAEEGKPVIFTATVQVRPEVKLGDYRSMI